MVRRQRHRLVKPSTEVGHDVFPRPPETNDADAGLCRNGVLNVWQIERGAIAQQSGLGVKPEPSKPLPDHSWAIGMLPRQQRWLVEGAYGVCLLVENLRQRCRAAAPRADAENNGFSFHRRILHWIRRQQKGRANPRLATKSSPRPTLPYRWSMVKETNDGQTRILNEPESLHHRVGHSWPHCRLAAICNAGGWQDSEGQVAN